MKIKIKIEIEGAVFEAVLTNEFSPKTMEKIANSLPIESEVMTWGDELYFAVPIEMDEENAKVSVTKGDIGFWPAGKTPLSESEEKIIPASPVNIVGRIEDPDRLKRIEPAGGEKIKISEWQW
jgi:hypothetical protein